MKYKFSILMLLIVLSSAIYAQQITQQFSFLQGDVQIAQTEGYDMISIGEEDFLQGEENAGKPQLPVKYFKLLLPKGASATNVSITINSEQQLSSNFYLYPVQMPVYPDFSEPPAFVEPDPTIYNSDNPFPENYILNYETSGFRDYNYVTVSFIPFRYIPLSQQLHLLTNITITVDYTVYSIAETHKLRPYGEVDEIASNFIKKTVINPTQTDIYYPEATSKINEYNNSKGTGSGNRGFEPTELPALEGSPVYYVIITNNTDVFGNIVGEGNFTDKFQEFADWKTQTGTPAKVITVDAIRKAYPGVDIAEQIREFIKDAHKLWGTEYILLGGNASIVPVRWINGNYMPTDLYYSAVWHSSNGYNDNWNKDGDLKFGESTSFNGDYCDFTPDIAVGRAPVDTEADVELFLEKNFTYSRCSLADDIPSGAWLNKQLNIGGIVYEVNWPSNGPGTNNLGLPTFWFVENNFSDDSEQYTMLEYMQNWNVTHPDWWPAYSVMDEKVEHTAVLDKINEKPGIIFHLDHSSEFNLGLTCVTHSSSSLYAPDWNTLTNSSQYPFLIGGGCHTAPIDRNNYIGESWLSSHRGGVAFLGTAANITTVTTYSYHQNFFSYLYDMNVNKAGLLKNMAATNQNTKYKIFQLLGDPALSIYTDEPITMNVTHNNEVTTGNSDLIASISNFPVGNLMKVCLYKENEVLAFGKTGLGGPFQLNITPDTPGKMKLTVTCHNAEPYEAIITVKKNDGVHLYNSNYTFTDENGNGLIEPGETITLSLELSNSGLTTATNISAILSSTDDYITITQNTSDYADISTDNSASSIIDYVFTVGTEDIDNGKQITFNLDINSTQINEDDGFMLNINACELEQGNKTAFVNKEEVTDFSSGDVVSLYIDIQNYGTVTATGLQAELTTNLSSDIINITNSEQTYIDINPKGVQANSNAFVFELTDNYAGGDLTFTLELTDNFNRVYSYKFNLLEALPREIKGFEFNSSSNYIESTWTKLDNIKGYNIYRSDTQTGTYEKVNDFVVTGTSMYYDPEVEILHEYYYKISAISLTGNERSVYKLTPHLAWTSLELVEGFPVKPHNIAVTSAVASPTVYDIDGDGTKEIFQNFKDATSGRIMAYDGTGAELFDIDGNPTEVWGFATTTVGISSNSAVGDFDNDGQAEVFTCGREPGTLYGFRTVDNDSDGNPDKLWSDGIIYTGNYNMLYSNPVLSDLTNDGNLEIILSTEQSNLLVYNKDKVLVWSRDLGYGAWYSMGEPAVADIDGDGYKEIILGIKQQTEDTDDTFDGAIYIFNSDGSDFNDSNPFVQFGENERADNGVVLADIDNDNEFEILTITKTNTTAYVYAFNLDGEPVNENWNGIYTINVKNIAYQEHIMPRISVGDINRDGNLEIVFGSKDKLHVLDNQGNPFGTFPITVGNTRNNAPILADIDGDAEIEIIINNDNIFAFNPDGSECVGWRLTPITGRFEGTPYVGDINKDGKNEIVVTSYDNETYIWQTTGDTDKIEWGSYRYNAQNTGVYKEECMFSETESITIDQIDPVTWNTDQAVRGDITIASNSKLIIESSISFTPDASIIVRPGGKLIIDGAKLTNSCGDLWQGITVLGNTTLSQVPESNQGVLEMR